MSTLENYLRPTSAISFNVRADFKEIFQGGFYGQEGEAFQDASAQAPGLALFATLLHSHAAG
jgi:hypothetical protein